ncbi:MAG: hypothetical protein CMG57_06865 [Candidatus Marinimicrobia bacterium]|nr:hypothetical protein [Candidatus Neomarinimicrobiota bacterium]
MEEELKSKFPGIETNLISSGGGVYEVSLDGNLIFSKKELKRFPDEREIEKLIKENSS